MKVKYKKGDFMARKNIKTVTVDEEKIDLYNRLTNGYKHKSGITVFATFSENGKDITECWGDYIKNKLKG